MSDTQKPNQDKSLTDYAQQIKKKKEQERLDAEENLKSNQALLTELETKATTLQAELFAIESLTLERCKEIIEELKPMSKDRVKIKMEIYKWETRINQLKYI